METSERESIQSWLNDYRLTDRDLRAIASALRTECETDDRVLMVIERLTAS